jgi:hypothetical protein
MMRNFSKMFLRARQALEFSHGLDPKATFEASNSYLQFLGWLDPTILAIRRAMCQGEAGS